ncbi:hypothetical protein [Burkholderia sp. Ac-20365]|jgi:hypothetical protein|uniref:hypothetical protein n=1 Tax=Burkholderia sp. Ac-20365 TaxID=2703897 RepID=UPI001F1210A9|nr:hypothetical protein [Burkholderia sp. Ac-20365]
MLVEIEPHPSGSAGYDAAMQIASFASLDRHAAGFFLAAQRRGIAVPDTLIMFRATASGKHARNSHKPIPSSSKTANPESCAILKRSICVPADARITCSDSGAI